MTFEEWLEERKEYKRKSGYQEWGYYDLLSAFHAGHMRLLTDQEIEVIELAARIARKLPAIADPNSSDYRRLVDHIHDIQNAVMSQAAGRAYPDRYRLMSEKSSG